MPVVEIPFIGPHAPNREKPLSSQVAKNMWPEINPEARNQVSLHNTAGLRTVANLDGADRGLHEFNGLLYAVFGGFLYSITDEGTSIQLGAITGSQRTVMANDPTQMIIVTGTTPYRYTVSGGVEAITDENLVNPNSVAYLNSQFIFDNNNGTFGEFVTSSIEAGLSIDALDFATAESHPDDIVRVIAYRQLVYFFGTHSVEPWRNTGKGNPPFARQDSGIRTYGLAGLHAITTTDEFIYFLDTKRRPRRSNGLDYQPIGNPSIGVEFAKYSKIDDCIVFEFTQDDQQLVAFTFPTANRTWCFHEPSGSWFQMIFGAKNDRHRATSMVRIYGLNFCADHSNGKLYEYSLDIFTDDGTPIVKQRDTAPIHGGLYGVPGKKLEFNEVEFIFASGRTEVAGTGLGAQPQTGDIGLCGTAADLTQGDLIASGRSMFSGASVTNITQLSPLVNGVSFDDTKVVCFTCMFNKSVPPDTGDIQTAIEINFQGAPDVQLFAFNMDENGFMNITGRNEARTEILSAQITNDGGSFADGTQYMFAVIIDMSDENRREIYINSVERGSSSWTTWDTYTNDILHIADNGVETIIYEFGNNIFNEVWGDTDTSAGGTIPAVGTESLGFITFDDTCSLIASSVWGKNGNIRDPQAWEGWYKTQPQVAWLPSFAKNSGKTAPATLAEITAGNTMEFDFIQRDSTGQLRYTYPDDLIYNQGIGATIIASDKGTLPDPPAAAPPVELVEPFWENEGTFIDISKLTQTTYADMFGVTIEGADFNKDVTVNKAALVNTSDSGNRIQLRDSAVYANGYLAVINSSGTIIDSMTYAGLANGDSVLVPTGADYYIVITSDTDTATVKKWDSITADKTGAVSFESVFGVAFGNFVVETDTTTIPGGGLSIWFDIPITDDQVRVSFAVVPIPSLNSLTEGSISTTVGDFNAIPNDVLSLGELVSGRINLSETNPDRIDLIPGNTYFFNIRYITGESNIVKIQTSYIVLDT